MIDYINLGIDLKGKTSGQIKTKCPKCHNQRKKKNAPSLSGDIDKGLFNCHHCGYSVSVKFQKKQEYQIPKENKNNVDGKVFSLAD